MEEFHPNVLLLHQPWMWPAAKAACEELYIKPIVIYSSQNVESELLSQILNGSSEAASKRLLRKAQLIEKSLLDHCRAIICVSASDEQKLKRDHLTLVLPNGVWPPGNANGYDKHVKRLARFSYAIFVGSAHPPNADGFAEMLSPNLTNMSPAQRIVVIGGVSQLLPELPFFKNDQGINYARVEIVGNQPQDVMEKLIRQSKGFILPITQGGGTNLKTAEALYWKKPIIATSVAIRGFERFIDYPHIKVTDTPQTFRSELRSMLEPGYPQPQFDMAQLMALEQLTWTCCLSMLSSFMSLASRLLGPPSVNQSSVISGRAIADCCAVGWHPYEEKSGSIWSRNKIAVLLIPIEIIANIEVTLSGTLYTPVNETRTLVVRTHDRKIGSFNVGDGHQFQIAFQIYKVDFYQSGELEVFLEIDKLYSPKSFEGDDERLLGINLGCLDIKPATNAVQTAVEKMRSEKPEASPENSFKVQQNGQRSNLSVLASVKNFSLRIDQQIRLEVDTIDGVVVSGQTKLSVRYSDFRSFEVRGWAISQSKDILERIQVVLEGAENVVIDEIRPEPRPDVAHAYNSTNLQGSGFRFDIPLMTPRGDYRLIFYGLNRKGRRLQSKRYALTII